MFSIDGTMEFVKMFPLLYLKMLQNVKNTNSNLVMCNVHKNDKKINTCNFIESLPKIELRIIRN